MRLEKRQIYDRVPSLSFGSLFTVAAVWAAALAVAPAANADVLETVIFTGTLDNSGQTFVDDAHASHSTTAGQAFSLTLQYDSSVLGSPGPVNAFTGATVKNWWSTSGANAYETVAMTIGGATASFAIGASGGFTLFNGASRAAFEISYALNDPGGYPFNDSIGGVQLCINCGTSDNVVSYLADPTQPLVPSFTSGQLSAADQQNRLLFDGGNINFTITGASVTSDTIPEPASLARFGLGAAALGVVRRRRA